MRLRDRVAMVTGGASGIGRAIALRFAQEGADIVIADIDLPKASSVVKEVESLGRKALALKVDVSQFSEVGRVVSQAIAQFGRIDILVNDAGVTGKSLLPEMTEEEWDRVLDINLKGCFNCSLFVSREMIKQKRGKIISISSVAAYTNRPGQVAYATAKGGVSAFTRAVAMDLAAYHINVNAIAPGSTQTALLTPVAGGEEGIKRRIAKIPLGRLAKTEDIAAAALFLASEDANHVTGAVLFVDGGEVISRTYG